MLPLSRSCCRGSASTSTLLHHHLVSPKPFHHVLCTYGTSQTNPLRRKSPPPKPNDPLKANTNPIASSKPPPTRLQVVLPPSTTFKPCFKPSVPLTDLNPPSTTHPPPLNLPQQDPDTPIYKYYYQLGKAYATFYKIGLKAIYTNYKAVRATNPPSNMHDLYAAVRSNLLTRANFQLIRRSAADVNKIPPFILLWVICGEFTPLVVFYVNAIVPRTIWIPKQVETARRQAKARRDLAYEEHPVHTDNHLSVGFLETLEELKPEPQKQFYSFIAQAYGLYPAWWDRWCPTFIQHREIKRRVYRLAEYIETDDFAIERDGGVRGLESEEVVRTCEERALDVVGKGEEELRASLEKYFWRKARVEGRTVE